MRFFDRPAHYAWMISLALLGLGELALVLGDLAAVSWLFGLGFSIFSICLLSTERLDA